MTFARLRSRLRVNFLEQISPGCVLCFIKQLRSVPQFGPNSSSSCKESNMSDVLSKQATACIQYTYFSAKHFRDVRNNRYHPVDNSEGVADLGLAENKMCEDLLIEKMTAIARLPESKDLLYYGKATGNVSFRQSMKKYFERFFHPSEPLSADNIFITNAVTVIIEAVAFAFAEPGDYIMVPSPYYYRTKVDIFDRPGVNTLTVSLTFKPGEKQGRLQLEAKVLEEVYQQAVNEGKHVRAIMLNNPINPTGDMIESAQLVELLQFANKYKLHVFSNEIYAQSVHDPDVKFTSILSLPHPDPERVHFAWGVSKDTGLSGYRCGFVHTKSPEFLQYLNNTLIYFRATEIIQRRLQAFLDDHVWMDQVFFSTMQKRLHNRFVDLRDALEDIGAHVHPGTSTIFIWVDFSEFLPEATFESEQWLFHQFLDERVFLTPGQDYGSDKPGWFRIVFSVDESVYKEGKKRIISVLTRIKQANTEHS